MTNPNVPTMPPNMDAVGVSWFREEDWPRWLAIDPNFQPDYQHWLKRTEKAIKDCEAAGHALRKVPVDPDEFLTWSRAAGCGVGTMARAEYVAMKTKQMRTH